LGRIQGESSGSRIQDPGSVLRRQEEGRIDSEKAGREGGCPGRGEGLRIGGEEGGWEEEAGWEAGGIEGMENCALQVLVAELEKAGSRVCKQLEGREQGGEQVRELAKEGRRERAR
jgi:hypothetical protein